MHAKSGSGLALCVLLGMLAQSRDVRADFAECPNPLPACTATSNGCCATTFPAADGNNPLLIAMDRCHQPLAGTSSTNGPPGSLAPRRELTIASIARAGSDVSVTTSAAHGLSSGQYVTVSGTTRSDLHGTFSVKTGNSCSPVCSTTTFQYETTASTGTINAAAGGTVLAHNYGNSWCVDSPGSDSVRIGGAAADTGMFKSYGLVYRLMQRNIPVYWLVNPSKNAPALTGNENASSQSHLANDVDFWVVTSDVTAPPTSAQPLTDCTGTCVQPVHRLKAADLTAYMDSYRKKEFPVRGSAFLIAAENRAAFNEFWTRTGAYAGLASQTKYAWATSGIDLYEIDATARIVHQNFKSGDGTSTSPFATLTGAPVASKINYEPPRIACLGCNSAVAQNWLATAGLYDPATAASCPSGEFSPSDATFCLVNDTDVAQGVLVSGGFTWMWMFGYNDNNPCADSSEKAVFDKIRDYMTTVPAVRNAGHGLFLDDSVKVAEGCANKQLMGTVGTGNGLDLQSSGGAEPFILRYPNNLFMQFGDVPIGFASGTVKGWKYYKSGSTVGYQAALQASGSSLRRLATVDSTGTSNSACIQHMSSVLCDVFTPTSASGDIMDMASYARFDDDLNNGIVYYLPGNQLDNSGNVSEMRLLLNSLLALPDESFTTTPTEIEVARSSPIVATVDSTAAVFQGTYVRLDPVPSIPKATTSSSLARFTFPYLQGHLRAIEAASFGACSGAACGTDNTGRTAISDLPGVIFDAADHLPSAAPAGCATNFNGSCRTVFTTTASGRNPARMFWTTGNVSTLGPIIAPNLTQTEQQTLISRILAGSPSGAGYVPKLGGIDRSTPAVIGPSPLAGSLGRPTMVYFGATDGMLHAVCASTGGGCDEVGRELWAYIPRTVMPDLRQSTARVDGSPHVIDAYGDFDNDGTKSFATILMFHTGTGRMTANSVVPAVYAIDITAPNNPKVIWEYAVTNVGARDTYELGLGVNITAGTILVNGVTTPVAYVQTNNGGIGGAASVLTAINVETGAKLWQFGDLYPTNGGESARSSAHEAAPASGIPGGAVAIDKTGNGYATHVVYGTLYGDVWVRDAATGAAQNGTAPLFRMAVDYKPIGVPPAIYAAGNTQFAAFATGGYVDTQATLWRGENESPRPNQLAFAVSLDYDGTTSLNENSPVTDVPFKFDLGANEGGFAQVMIVGGELFVVTDSTNVNSYDFGTATQPTGKVYRYDFGAATPTQGSTLVIASGAGSLFNNGTQLFSVSGRYGERLGQDAAGTTGTSVDPITSSTTNLARRLWLRTE